MIVGVYIKFVKKYTKKFKIIIGASAFIILYLGSSEHRSLLIKVQKLIHLSL